MQDTNTSLPSAFGETGTVGATVPAPSAPDHRAFLRHVGEARFQSGCDRDKWRLLDPVLWPYAFIAVTAPPRPHSPCEWVFRFDLSGYPHQAPTAGLWDAARHAPLAAANWPVGSGRFALAFNFNWRSGQAMYLPCDRVSLEGHDNWRVQHPHMIWTPDKDITFYLNILYDYFHSRDYQGVRPA